MTEMMTLRRQKAGGRHAYGCRVFPSKWKARVWLPCLSTLDKLVPGLRTRANDIGGNLTFLANWFGSTGLFISRNDCVRVHLPNTVYFNEKKRILCDQAWIVDFIRGRRFHFFSSTSDLRARLNGFLN